MLGSRVALLERRFEPGTLDVEALVVNEPLGPVEEV